MRLFHHIFWGGILLAATGPSAQEEASTDAPAVRSFCEYPSLADYIRLEAEAKLLDVEGRPLELRIRWAHYPQATDTFHITAPNGDYVEYITNGQERFVWTGPRERHGRRLAPHHLREPLFASAFYLDDLELIAKGAFRCQDSTEQKSHKLRTAQSQTWYTLALDTISPATRLSMHGARGRKRALELRNWTAVGAASQFPLWVQLSPQEFLIVTHYEPIVEEPAPHFKMPFPYLR